MFNSAGVIPFGADFRSAAKRQGRKTPRPWRLGRRAAIPRKSKAFHRAKDDPFGSVSCDGTLGEQAIRSTKRADYRSAAGYQPAPQVLQNQAARTSALA
jgi:hypothetical protein